MPRAWTDLDAAIDTALDITYRIQRADDEREAARANDVDRRIDEMQEDR